MNSALKTILRRKFPRPLRLWLLAGLLLLVSALAALELAVRSTRIPPLPQAAAVRLLDRHGIVLRTVNPEKGIRIPLEQVSPWLVQATILAEDRRFYHHPGVDPLALLRSAWQNLASGRVVSGGSTITQQVARNLLHSRERSLSRKTREFLLALQLERQYSKAHILETYFNLAPYANECYGAEAACRFYFGRPAASLSLAQAAFLAVIPRNPTAYNPWRHFDRARRAQQALLARMRGEGLIDNVQYLAAKSEAIQLDRPVREFAAGHFCDWVLAHAPPAKDDVRTTLDAYLTQDLENLARTYVQSLAGQGITNAAVVVMDNRDLTVRAMVGSVDYFSAAAGQVNGATALRQPGSTLKPFTYGVALEQDFPTSYLLPDVRTQLLTSIGTFSPRNYDEHFHGPVRLRTALGCSYNIPAVRILAQLGESALLAKLHQAGFASLKHSPDYYGVSLTLGGGEVSLLELTRAYGAIAHGGVYRDERFLIDAAPSAERQVFPPEVAYLLTYILSDRSARAPAFGECNPIDLPFPCAVKTGTSKDYRDNWTVGFTPGYIVGVWVGNFDGRPMAGVSGVSGAGPLFRDIMLRLHRGARPEAFTRPAGLREERVCPLSGDRVSAHCPDAITELFLPKATPTASCRFHRAAQALNIPPEYHDWAEEKVRPAEIHRAPGTNFGIVTPNSGVIFKIDPGLRREYQSIPLKASFPAGIKNPTWVMDGIPVLDQLEGWWTLRPGRHILVMEGRLGGRPVRTRAVTFLVLE